MFAWFRLKQYNKNTIKKGFYLLAIIDQDVKIGFKASANILFDVGSNRWVFDESEFILLINNSTNS